MAGLQATLHCTGVFLHSYQFWLQVGDRDPTKDIFGDDVPNDDVTRSVEVVRDNVSPTPSQTSQYAQQAANAGYEIPARLRTLHNLVIQYASQGRLVI